MFTTRNLLIVIGKNIGIALFVAILVGVGISILNKEISRVSSNLIKNQTLANTLKNRTELFAILKHDAEIVGTNDIAIEHAFLPSDNILEFVSSLESLALRNSVTQTYRFDSPFPAQYSAPFGLAAISYTENLSTNILTLTNFMKDFEHLPYFTRIDGISVSAQDRNGWTGSSQATIRATLYTKTTE